MRKSAIWIGSGKHTLDVDHRSPARSGGKKYDPGSADLSRVSTFSEAQIKRAMKAARAVDPMAVVEVTRDGTIRILPHESKPVTEVDKWFSDNDTR